MSKTHATNKKNRKDIFQKVTDIVIEHLENGEIMWQKPWSAAGQPKNLKTEKEYRGFNRFFLNMTLEFGQYKTPYFLTFKQAKEMGGKVKRGSKGYPIVYWAKAREKKEVEEIQNGVTSSKTVSHEVDKLIPCGHTVFNLEQIEGIDIPEIKQNVRTETQKIESCEKVVSEMQKRPPINNFGNKAYYSPVTDRVVMPEKNKFKTDEDYYQTLFHELAHSTGHETRLNRKEVAEKRVKFGSTDYSKEELVAEMTSSFLTGFCGIDIDDYKNSAAYLQGWLKALKNDKRLLISAASKAEKAANFILNEK